MKNKKKSEENDLFQDLFVIQQLHRERASVLPIVLGSWGPATFHLKQGHALQTCVTSHYCWWEYPKLNYSMKMSMSDPPCLHFCSGSHDNLISCSPGLDYKAMFLR